jgi:hypothetical protein
MGIVRRCGRPPRLTPLIKKLTRECVSIRVAEQGTGARHGANLDGAPGPHGALGSPEQRGGRVDAGGASRTVTACLYPLHYRLDRRLPPRLAVVLRDRPPGDVILTAGEPEQVICSCRVHGGRCDCPSVDQVPSAGAIRAPERSP